MDDLCSGGRPVLGEKVKSTELRQGEGVLIPVPVIFSFCWRGGPSANIYTSAKWKEDSGDPGCRWKKYGRIKDSQ